MKISVFSSKIGRIFSDREYSAQALSSGENSRHSVRGKTVAHQIFQVKTLLHKGVEMLTVFGDKKVIFLLD
jgi:ribosomal protein S6E (S10)